MFFFCNLCASNDSKIREQWVTGMIFFIYHKSFSFDELFLLLNEL